MYITGESCKFYACNVLPASVTCDLMSSSVPFPITAWTVMFTTFEDISLVSSGLVLDSTNRVVDADDNLPSTSNDIIVQMIPYGGTW